MYSLIIADDEVRIRCGMRNCINWSELDFKLAGEAENGKDALNLVLKLRPDLIITDIRMPEMDGLELVEAVRNLGIHSLIILISGYNDFSYAQQAIRFGVTDYLLKPIDEEELYERILNCTQKLNIASDLAEQSMVLSGNKQENNLLIKKAKEFMESNYNKNIHLEDVANAVCVHPNYLSSLFSRLTRQRLSEYLCRLRISKAKTLMQNPSFKIYEVAELVGYSDYRWFSKVFKHYEGISPAEYKGHGE